MIVPLLDETEREWWNETDMTGMSKSSSQLHNEVYHTHLDAIVCVDVPNPDPTAAMKLLSDVLKELQQDPYQWSGDCIHLFGFGQGGTLACETALQLGKNQQQDVQVGSIVTIQGPLLSLPYRNARTLSTMVLYVYRGKNGISTKTQTGVAALERVFTSVKTLRLPEKNGAAVAMPDNKDEWKDIMTYWSEHLQSSSAWQRKGEVYEVTGGQSNVNLPQQPPAASSKKIPKNQDAHVLPSSTIDMNVPVSASSAPARSSSTAPSGFKRGFLSRGL